MQQPAVLSMWGGFPSALGALLLRVYDDVLLEGACARIWEGIAGSFPAEFSPRISLWDFPRKQKVGFEGENHPIFPSSYCLFEHVTLPEQLSANE